MAFTNRVTWAPLLSFDTSILTTSYQSIGTALPQPAFILKLLNTSSSNVLISIDGVNDIDVIPANSFFLYDEDKGTQREMLQQGTLFFFKLETGAVASAGHIYLVEQYLLTN